MPKELEEDFKKRCRSRLRSHCLDTGDQAYLHDQSIASTISRRPNYLQDVMLKVTSEFEAIKQIVKDSGECRRFGVPEPVGWHSQVREDVLQVAIKGRDAAVSGVPATVDYAELFRPPGDEQVASAVEALINTVKEDRRTVFEGSDTYALRFTQVGLVVQGKHPQGNSVGAEYQLGLWIRAFRDLIQELFPGKRTTSLPVVILGERYWDLAFACEIDNKMVSSRQWLMRDFVLPE